MSETDFKRKLTAVFSADVVGYSRLMGEDEAATVKTLETYKGGMFSLIKQHRGRVVDSTGDNLLAEFASVVDAVQCALAVQKELQARNADLPENRRMQFRIGINLGDVIEEEDRLYGDGVNIAARLEALADPGGICVSKTAFDHIESKLPLGYEFLGDQTVKNIAKPVGAYKVLMETRVVGAKEKKEPTGIPFRKRKAFLSVSIVVILAVIAALFWNFYLRRPSIEPASKERMAYPLPEKPSIAVMAFDNLSGDPEQEYIGDSITENIITALSMAPRLFVIARNSSFSYKGKPVKVQQVAEELGVRYVLEGSVQKSGEKLRITAQLIDAIKGHHIWSDRYDRNMKDIFALQDEIVMKIMSAIQVKLTIGERARLEKKGTDNLEAYIKVMQGLEYLERRTKETNIQARKLAEEAIELDPDYPHAYTLLAQTYQWGVMNGQSKFPRKDLQEAFKSRQKALSIDESHYDANKGLSYLYAMQKQFEKCLAQAERTVALYPNMAGANVILGGALFRVGRYEESIPYLEKAIRLDPKGPSYYYLWLGEAYCFAGRYEEAIAEINKAIGLAPNSPQWRVALAAAYSMAGREDEARAEAAEALKLDPKFSLKQYAKAMPWRKDVLEPWLDALRKAGLPETPPLPLPDKPSIAVLPFTNMSGDPEQEYLGDAISEEIIAALSKVAKMFVIARTSSFKYKGKEVDVRTVGRELGVRYVLEGSVRRSKDQLRIIAQLIDAKKGSQLWAERYDRGLEDIFALQDEITMKIITALEVELTEGETASLTAKGTHNLMAYLNCLRGREHFRRSTKEDNVSARRFLKEAIALDPEYPVPHSWLGSTHMMDAFFQTTKSPKQSLNQAVQLAQKAIALDDSYASAHGLLGFLYSILSQHDKGIAEGSLAIALNPNGATEHAWLSITLRYAGRCEEAVQMGEKAIRLNPFPPGTIYRLQAWNYICTGRYEQALAACKNALNLIPKDLFTRLALAITYNLSGRKEAARTEAKEALRIEPKFSLEKYAKTVLKYKNKAYVEKLINALRQAGLPEKSPQSLPDKPSIAVLPFKNMSSDSEQEYFSDGITEDLITDLSKISGLLVIARNSAFRYKGKALDVKKVGSELGVRYVLEGSVRKAGDQVRITAQLIDASTGFHLWSERYDGKMGETFEMQDKIRGKIVKALAVQLTPSEQDQVTRKDTENVTAYDSFLKARAHYIKHTPEDFAKALSHFENTIETDPNYRKAYFFMALIYSKASKFGKRWLDALDLSNAMVAEGQAKKYLELSKFKIVFVTSEKYTGNLGGIAGACQKCQRLAETAGLPGTYRAWLSDKTSSPAATFTRWNGPYVLVDGTEVASSWLGLTEDFHFIPINLTETGLGTGESFQWTNTGMSGGPGACPCPERIEKYEGRIVRRAAVRDGSCQNWTSSNGDLYDGLYGNSIGIGTEWTYSLASTTSATSQVADCNEMLRLYCFQQ